MQQIPSDAHRLFLAESAERVATYPLDAAWKDASSRWMVHGFQRQYMYNFSWLGRPIIQLPQDMVALQEAIWTVRPDLIIETGIAHGGSLGLSASMLAMLDLCDGIEQGGMMDPRGSSRMVLGVDIDIRPHNERAIEAHPMSSRIRMIQGSSVDPSVISRVREIAAGYRRVMVCLDSNHTHEHVLAELRAYAPLTSVDSLCIVFDTVVDDLPKSVFPDRPWGPGNNPKTAVHEWLGANQHFCIDRALEDKLLLTAAPHGYLRRMA